VDHAGLARRAAAAGTWIEVAVRVGDFVPKGSVVALVHGDDPVAEQIAACFVQGVERTIDGDVTFGLRQLVDIAERALSPGINDPSTAVQCLDQLHHLLRRLAHEPPAVGLTCDEDGVPRVVHPTVTWDEVVALALDEIRNKGADSLQVQQRMERLLRDLLRWAPAERRPPLERRLEALLRRRAQDLPAVERELVAASADPVELDARGRK
jgi:uncharacterized membrane protein